MSDKAHGSSLGRALSHVLSDVLINSSAAMSDHQQAARIRANEGFLEGLEAHLAPRIDAALGHVMADDNMPPALRMALKDATDPGHPFDFVTQLGIWIADIFGTVFAVLQAETPKMTQQLLAGDPYVAITPAMLADMAERNIVGYVPKGDPSQWVYREAAMGGISADRFDLMVKDTGEPYGVDQALSLWRRGLITAERLTEIVYYSRVRNEFLPDVKLLAHDTMTGGDAIEGVLKGVLDPATGGDLFAKAGGLPEQFQTLVDIAGNPIGVEQAMVLWNHGLISEAEVDKIILHSRVNPMFTADAKQLRHRWLSVIQIELALKAGAVTPAAASTWLAEDGYPADQIAAFVQGAASAKVSQHKQLNETQILDLYDTGMFTADQATAELQSLGYDPGEAPYILAVYEQRRLLSMAQAAVGQVRRVYLAGRIDGAQATADLQELGIDPTAIHQYLAVWDVEAKAEIRTLSMAQVGSAFKKGLITSQDALTRWTVQGYDATDAALLLAEYGGPPPAGSPAAAAATAGPTPPVAG